jgi:List-Bact-rpt repeat protein
VTLTPTAFGGSFVGWKGIPGKLRPQWCLTTVVCSYAVESGSTWLKAAFTPVELAFDSTSGGSVEVLTPGSPCGRNCYRYEYGSLVRIRAHNNEGFSFYQWYGRCERIGAGCRFNIDDNVKVSAIFSCNFSPCKIEQPVTTSLPVTVVVRGPGTAVYRGLACRGRCRKYVPKLDLLSIEARPNQGASIAGWSGTVNCSGSGNRCSFPVFADASGSGPTVYVDFR